MSKSNFSDELFATSTPEPTVYVVDDDAAICDAITSLLEIEGFRTQTFQDARMFLEVCSPGLQGCILLDLCLPDSSGLTVVRALAERGVTAPVIILTGHGTIPGSSEAFRLGVFDFLEKPFRGDALLRRVIDALHQDERRRIKDMQKLAVSERYARLSEREREVLRFVVDGLSSKEMAKHMGISHRTVEIYRAHAMRKMGSDSLVDLLRMMSLLHDGREEPR